MKDLKTEEVAQLKVKETIVVDQEPSEVEVASAVCVEKTYPEPAPDLGARYDVLDFVGSGGMGTVWKVYDKELKETFAIKVLKPELLADDVSLKRFQQEARLATDLTHANIAAIFGPGEDTKGRPYIIMRYVEGESLAETLYMEGALEPERALDIFWQVYAALKHSHMKGIVHRDVKPSNIILTRTESGGDLVQLVDFGISKSIHEEVSKTQALTKAVDVFGSPRYMSPEQFLGKEVGPESDLYSLGCVLFEMLTGSPPFTDENPVKLVLQHLQESPDMSKIVFGYQSLVSSLLLKEERVRSLATSDLELLGNEKTAASSNIEDGFAIAVTTFSFYLPSAISTLVATFSDLSPQLPFLPLLLCNLGFAFALTVMGLNNPIKSQMFKEVSTGVLFSITSSLAMLILTLVIPKAYLLLAFVLLGLATLVSLTVPSLRQKIDQLAGALGRLVTSSKFQSGITTFIQNFLLSMRLLLVCALSAPLTAVWIVEKGMPHSTAIPFVYACFASSAMMINYGMGVAELQLEKKGHYLRSVPFSKMSRQRLLRGLLSITATGILAVVIGLLAGNFMGYLAATHQFPFNNASSYLLFREP